MALVSETAFLADPQAGFDGFTTTAAVGANAATGNVQSSVIAGFFSTIPSICHTPLS